jgi:hypothetical protein
MKWEGHVARTVGTEIKMGFRNNKEHGLDLSGPEHGGMKQCTEQGNLFRSLETAGCIFKTVCCLFG